MGRAFNGRQTRTQRRRREGRLRREEPVKGSAITIYDRKKTADAGGKKAQSFYPACKVGTILPE